MTQLHVLDSCEVRWRYSFRDLVADVAAGWAFSLDWLGCACTGWTGTMALQRIGGVVVELEFTLH